MPRSRTTLAFRTRIAASVALTIGVAAAGSAVATAPATAAPGPCPNAAIRAEQGSEALPDCRGLEMVSPVAKNGAAADPKAIDDTGTRVMFAAKATFGDAQSALGQNFYVAKRGAEGWSSNSINLPSNMAPILSQNFAQAVMPPDLSRALWIGQTNSERAAGRAGMYSVVPGGPTDLVGALNPVVPQPNSVFQTFAGSSDLTHVLFKQDSSISIGTTVKLLGDESVLSGRSGGYNLWEAVSLGSGAPVYRSVNRDDAGAPLGGACGASLGGFATSADFATTMQHAISQDGKTIYFIARPSEPAGDLYCITSATDGSVPPSRVYARIDGAHTVEVSKAVCARTVPSPNPDGITACDTTDGSDLFQGASTDGSRVVIQSPRQLTDSDFDIGGQDLYVYNASPPAGQPKLVQASRGDGIGGATDGAGAGVKGVVRVSDDASRVYFVASGVLTKTANDRGDVAGDGDNNLYVFERDAAHPTGRIAFLSALDSADADLWAINELGGPHRAYAVPRYGAGGPATGGDGHVLVLQSTTKLTADDHDNAADVFRYDDLDGSLVRVSKAADGAGTGAGDGPFDASITSPSQIMSAYPNALQSNRSVTEDGQMVAFMTAERLEPRDENGVRDAYVWQREQVARVSVGTSVNGVDASVSGPVWVTPSGGDVFFKTADRLVPQDIDGTPDIYDARIDGGFLVPPDLTDQACVGETCQGPQALQPPPSVAATVDFAGAGNVILPTPPALVPVVKPSVSKPKRVRGTRATLKVKVPGKGKLRTSGSGLRRTSKTVTKAGRYSVRVRLSKRARATLKRKHRFKAKVRVAFTPSVGKRSTVSVRVTFRQAKRAHRKKPSRRAVATGRHSRRAGR